MYMYMMVHPGKKLNFMGNEIGQLREWDEKRQQDWELRQYPIHDGFYHYMHALNYTYLNHPALWAWDYKPEGFQWLDCHQEQKCIYALERRSEKECLAAIFNFSDQKQEKYTLTIPNASEVMPMLCSDWERFGGHTPESDTLCVLDQEQLTCSLPPFSGLLLNVSVRPSQTSQSQVTAQPEQAQTKDQ